MFSKLRFRTKYNVYLAVCLVNLASASTGCFFTWSSPTYLKITTPGERIFVTKEQATWIISILGLGSAIGPFVSIATVDYLGRKRSILMNTLLQLLSWIIIITSKDFRLLCLARFIAGCAIGGLFTVVPMYVAEISPESKRGFFGSSMGFFMSFGVMVPYGIGSYTSFLILAYICASFPAICILLFIWMPESPYHLVNKGRSKDAYNSLEWLRGNAEISIIQKELAHMQEENETSKDEYTSISDLSLNRGHLKALYYCFTLAFFQQMSGISIVVSYTQSIFEQTGSSFSTSISTIIIGLVMLSSASVTAPAAHFIGIRKLLIFSSIGEAISAGILSYYFYLKSDHQDVSNIGWIPITSLILFITFFNNGIGPFLWVILSELFPMNLKVTASGVTSSFCFLMSFIVTELFPTLSKLIGISYVFLLFSIFCLFCFVFVLVQLPNTQNKSFGEIQEMLHGKIKPNF